MFLTLEDEWGLMNVIIKPKIFRDERAVWSRSMVLMVQGEVQRMDRLINVMAEKGWKIR